jgi:SAM-dependent methyltransferase
VDLETVAWLASDAGRVVLQGVTAYDDAAHERAAAGRADAVDPVRAVAAARAAHPEVEPALVSAALTQVRLRRRARPRLGALADHVLLTEDGLEQATRTVVADLRAQRFADAGATHVADLGCGLGLDSAAFARVGLHVTAVELDPVVAALAGANLAALGLADRTEVLTGDVTDPATLARALDRADAAYADPARRDTSTRREGRSARLADPQSWSPPWSWVEQVAAQVPRTAVKVAPGIPHELTPDGGCATWTSVDGQLVEAELAWPALAPPHVRRRALVVRHEQVTSMSSGDDLHDAAPAAIGAIGRRLVEPDDAVIRAGLVADLAEQLEGRLLDPRVAYVTTDSALHPGDLGATFTVRESLPYTLPALRARLVAQGVGHVVVKKRAISADPDEVRRALALPAGPGRAVVVLTRIGDDPWAYICDPA